MSTSNSVPPPLPGFDAIAYHPSLAPGENRGQLWLDPASIYFRNQQDVIVSLPLTGIDIRRGGATGDLIQVTHLQHPGVSFSTSDKRILNDQVLASNPGLTASIRTSNRRRGCCWAGCGLFALAVLALIITLIAMRETIVEIVTDKIPVSWEQKLGDITFAQIEATTKLVDDPQLVAHLDELAKPLLDSMPLEDKRYPFKLHLANDPTPNAFAVPGGNIVVHTGLIQKAARGEEVAGVLAHEIAHVTRRHSLRQLVNQAGLIALLQATVGDVGGLIGVATEAGHYLLTQSYSRDAEREADEIAWKYMTAAKIDPRGLGDFFEKLKEEETAAGSPTRAMNLLSTHPATEERIAALEEKEKALSGESYTELTKPFEALKAGLPKE